MAGTTNDEELLILSDDTDSGNEFVLEEQVIDDNKQSSQDNELISFDSDLPSFDISLGDSENNETLVLEDQKEDEGAMLSFGDDTIEVSDKTEKMEASTETEDFEFSLGDSTQETETLQETETTAEAEETDLFSQSLNEEVTESSTVGTMADILDEAIAKFSKREEVIALNIASKEEHIKSLREQIASLESSVNNDNEEVARLNTEKQSIVKNRKALEKMKELPVTTK